MATVTAPTKRATAAEAASASTTTRASAWRRLFARRAAAFGVLVIAGSQNLCGPVDRALVERVSAALHAQIIAAIPAGVGRERAS